MNSGVANPGAPLGGAPQTATCVQVRAFAPNIKHFPRGGA